MPMSLMPWAPLTTLEKTWERVERLDWFFKEPRSVFLVPSSQVTIALITLCSTTQTLEEPTTLAASVGSR